jgi:hypothetical protein
VVVLVRDLPAAVVDYSGLGFTVVDGGTHAGGATHNALIGFADGTYLELIAFTRPPLLDLVRWLDALRVLPLALLGRPALERRFVRRAAGGEGLTDWAVVPLTLDDATRLGSRVSLAGPFVGHRVRTNGTRISWDVFVPRDEELPFVVVDRGARSLRMPAESAFAHPNGVVGIASIGLDVRDAETSARRYAPFLEGECARTDAGWRFWLSCPDGGHQATIALASSPRAGRGTITRRVHSLTLRTADRACRGPLDTCRTHGARILIV